MAQRLGEVMTPAPQCLDQGASVLDAARRMRDSIGDLALDRDPESALADISAAPANA